MSEIQNPYQNLQNDNRFINILTFQKMCTSMKIVQLHVLILWAHCEVYFLIESKVCQSVRWGLCDRLFMLGHCWPDDGGRLFTTFYISLNKDLLDFASEMPNQVAVCNSNSQQGKGQYPNPKNWIPNQYEKSTSRVSEILITGNLTWSLPRKFVNLSKHVLVHVTLQILRCRIERLMLKQL